MIWVIYRYLLFAGTDFVLFGTLDLLLSVFELSSLSSSFLFDFFSDASSDLSESDFVFLEVVKTVVDVSESGSASTTKFGLHTVDDDAVGGRFVHLGQRFPDFL